MKKIIIISSILISAYSFSQIAIGKSTVDGSALLDFGPGNKGLILPATTTITSAVAGTLTFNATTKYVEYYNGTEWKQLSSKTGEYTTPNITEVTEIGEGAIMGDQSSVGTVKGVLILQSLNKALVLPKVADPHLNIKSPEPGTICYDTTAKAVAVFNGAIWDYWY